jgi:hypothetical protein
MPLLPVGTWLIRGDWPTLAAVAEQEEPTPRMKSPPLAGDGG